MAEPASLRELDAHFTKLVVENPISCVMYSTALKVFGLFLTQLAFPLGLYGWLVLFVSLSIEIKVKEKWAEFNENFLVQLDIQLEKAEQKAKELFEEARDVGMQQAVSQSVRHPWPVTVNVTRGVYTGATGMLWGAVGGIRNWWNRQPPADEESDSENGRYADLERIH